MQMVQDFDLTQYRQISQSLSKVVLDYKGRPVEFSCRYPTQGEYVVIDALNIVLNVETFNPALPAYFMDSDIPDAEKRVTAYHCACQIAIILGYMLGDDFTEVYDLGKGQHFYNYDFRIGSPDNPLGSICLGNKKGESCLIMLTGHGCHMASNGWEFALYQWLENTAVNPKITRCDLAHDDFNGDYSTVEWANECDTQGKFALTNRLPQVQHLGDWKRHVGKGRTLQVGSRESGKLIRIYEKGKQLGDCESLWLRSELELSNKSKIIPLDILLHPTQYFVGAYPYCGELISLANKNGEIPTPQKIEIIQKTGKIQLKKSIEILKHQFGKYLAVYREIYGSDTEIMDLLVSDKKDIYPKRLATVKTMFKNPPDYFAKYYGMPAYTKPVFETVENGDDLETYIIQQFNGKRVAAPVGDDFDTLFQMVENFNESYDNAI